MMNKKKLSEEFSAAGTRESERNVNIRKKNWNVLFAVHYNKECERGWMPFNSYLITFFWQTPSVWEREWERENERIESKLNTSTAFFSVMMMMMLIVMFIANECM